MEGKGSMKGGRSERQKEEKEDVYSKWITSYNWSYINFLTYGLQVTYPELRIRGIFLLWVSIHNAHTAIILWLRLSGGRPFKGRLWKCHGGALFVCMCTTGCNRGISLPSQGSQFILAIFSLHNLQRLVAPSLWFWLFKHQKKTQLIPNKQLYLLCGKSILVHQGPSNISFHNILLSYERKHEIRKI